ncbi:MAG TPA: response regulator [Candidatus Dormibacteraeota bacterium]|nr:response regulator [Candidatus Dormibacteraeota bacterium]
MKADHSPTVFIIDNDAPLRASLRFLVESADLAGEEFGSAEAFLAAYDPERPGCLILDVRLPGMSGVVLQETLRDRGCRLPIIVMTGFADVGTAVGMLKGGAFDFFEKPFADQQLLERVHQAISFDGSRRRASAQREALTARIACLTAREHEVFQEVVHGKANKVVALEFGISEKTVEVHRARVMQKLGAASLAELVRMDLLAQQPTDSLLLRVARSVVAQPPAL